MIILGFDVGRKKTGVAIGNLASRIARPLTIARGGRAAQMAEVSALVAEWQPQRLIVGMPMHADGTKHKMSKTAQVFGDALAAAFALPVSFVDERYSTIAARMTKPGKDADAAAAGIILQDWLDGGGEADDRRCGEKPDESGRIAGQ